MKFQMLITMLFLLFSFSIAAQTFAPAFAGYSRKKPAYVTMKDGSEVTVLIKKLAFKKGLVDEVKLENINGGKKVKVNPEDISHMYIHPGGLSKMVQKMNAATDLTKIRDGELSSEHLDDGYLYMESSNVQVKKKKTQYCMLQLMNPSFSKKIKVYNDPLSKETASVGVGGMKMAGGLAKSYYIKKEGEDLARRIKKKEYKQDMEALFSECPDVLSKYSADPSWSEFEKFIFEYSTTCN